MRVRVFVPALLALCVAWSPSATAGPLIPVSASDTIVAVSGDDIQTGPHNLGFTFPFFGADHTSVYMNSNGNLSFVTGFIGFGNVSFPTDLGLPALPLVAPLWDDLYLLFGDMRINGTTPGVFVAIWNDVEAFADIGSRLTLEAALFGAGNPYGLTAGSILFSYGDLLASPLSPTVGLNAGNNWQLATLFGLGIGAAGGELTEAQALALANRSFLFTPDGAPDGAPDGGWYSVQEINELQPAVEPGSLLLVGAGLAAAGRRMRRRR